MIPSTLILSALAAFSNLKSSPFYTTVLRPTLDTFLNDFKTTRAIAVFNTRLTRLQYPIEDWSGECPKPRVDCSAFISSHIAELLQPIARKVSPPVESTPATAYWKHILDQLVPSNIQFGLGLKSCIVVALLSLVAIAAVIIVLKELSYRIKYLARVLEEYVYHVVQLEHIILDLKTSNSNKAHENIQLHAALKDKRAESRCIQEQHDNLLVTVTHLENQLEAATRPPLVTAEVACQVDLPETASVSQQTQNSETTQNPSSQVPEPAQTDSSRAIDRLSKQWEGKVSYLNETISHLRQQAVRAGQVQNHLSGIISHLTEENAKVRSRASVLAEQKQNELTAKKDLQRANVQLEHALAKAEKTEERQSRFLECALARSKDSEKHVKHLLDEEQIASGALRLKVAGVSLQTELVEAEKKKVKSLEEQLEATRLELQSTKTENEKLREAVDVKNREVSDQVSTCKQELGKAQKDFARLQALHDWERNCLLGHEERLFESIEREFALKATMDSEVEKQEEFRQAASEAIRSLAEQANELTEANSSIDILQAQVTTLTSERDELLQARTMANQQCLEAEARHEAAVEEVEKLAAEINGLRECLERQEATAAEAENEKRRASVDAKHRELSDRVLSCDQELENAQKDFADLWALYDRERKCLLDHEESLFESLERESSLKTKLKKEVKRQEGFHQEANEAVRFLANKLNEANSSIGILQVQVTSLTSERDEHLQACVTADQLYLDAEVRYGVAVEGVRKLDAEISGLRERLETEEAAAAERQSQTPILILSPPTQAYEAEEHAAGASSREALEAEIRSLTAQRDDLLLQTVADEQRSEAELREDVALEISRLIMENDALRECLEDMQSEAIQREDAKVKNTPPTCVESSIQTDEPSTEVLEAEIQALTAQRDDLLHTQTAADEQRSRAELREEAALEEISRLILENDALRECLEEMHSEAIQREDAEAKNTPAIRLETSIQTDDPSTEVLDAEIQSLTAQRDDLHRAQTAADEERSKAELREEAALEEISRLIMENDALKECLEDMHSEVIQREDAEAKNIPACCVESAIQTDEAPLPSVSHLEEEIDDLKAKETELSRDVAQICVEKNGLAETIDQLETREKLLQDRLHSLERQRASEERDRAKISAQFDHANRRAEELDNHLKQTAEDLQDSRVKETRARSELSAAKENVAKLRDMVNRYKVIVERSGSDLFEIRHSPTSPTFASADLSVSSASSSTRSLAQTASLKGGLMTPNDTPIVPAEKRRAVSSTLGSHDTAGKEDESPRAAWIGKGRQVLKATGLGDRLAQPRFDEPPPPSPT